MNTFFVETPANCTQNCDPAMMIQFDLLVGTTNQSQFLGDLFHLNALSLRWTSLGAGLVKGQPPSARYGHGMATIQGSVYIFGGLGASGEAVAEGALQGVFVSAFTAFLHL